MPMAAEQDHSGGDANHDRQEQRQIADASQ
jgi:hypothetical protein